MILETERLYLREMTQNDFGDLAENVLSVLKYFKNLKGGKKCQ